MTGASGQIVSTGHDDLWANINATTTLSWRQEYTPGNNYSDIIVSVKVSRDASPSAALGGTWYPSAAGSITVNGEAAISWGAYGVAAGFGSPGAVGWEATGTVRVAHTGSVDITIAIPGIRWVNTSYNNLSFGIGGKTETVTLQAVEALGTARIGNATYDIYIGGTTKYDRYRAYVGAVDGSEWLPMS